MCGTIVCVVWGCADVLVSLCDGVIIAHKEWAYLSALCGPSSFLLSFFSWADSISPARVLAGVFGLALGYVKCITTEPLLSCAFHRISTDSNGFPVPTQNWIWLLSVFDDGLAFCMLTIFHISNSNHNMGSGMCLFWFVTGAYANSNFSDTQL